jgi:hypothetical protein
MIISHSLRYVYIGIPRTGSKSMNRWLMKHCAGEWVGDHHDWRVPDDAKDYLVFTTVRNPYDRAVSGYFGIPWGELDMREDLREQLPLPDKSTNPLTKIVEEARARNAATNEGVDMSQKDYVTKAGVSLVLYFERLPQALRELPFASAAAIAEFPHVLERGIRPAGTFFDFFSDDDEAAYWAYTREEFEAFGYERFSSGLAADAPDVLRL